MGQEKHIDSDNALSEAESQAHISQPRSNSSIDDVHCEKKYKCTYPGCNKQFLRPSRLTRHLHLHNGERPFKCSNSGCDKAYTNSSHLKRHMQTHNVVKKTYQCAQCSLMISNLHNLKRHYERVHNENNKISCKECKATFTKKHQLAQHMATHANSVYKCEKCNKSFTNPHRFEKHVGTHAEKKKSYPCTYSQCSEVFHKWNDLCAHLKTQHVPEYKCADCGKTFLNKSSLKFHVQIHIENRPVILCPYEKCHRQYFFRQNLDHHIRSTHKGEKFYCNICGIGLSTKQKLIEHIAYRHDHTRVRKKTKKLQRKKRKDAGVSKKSVVSTLVGVVYQPALDKVLLQRDVKVQLAAGSDKLLGDASFDRNSDA